MSYDFVPPVTSTNIIFDGHQAVLEDLSVSQDKYLKNEGGNLVFKIKNIANGPVECNSSGYVPTTLINPNMNNQQLTNISTLEASNGTITTLGSTNGTIGTLNSTTGTIGTLNSTDGTITNITGTTCNISTINGTTGTITTLNSTTGNITNANTTNTSISNIATIATANITNCNANALTCNTTINTNTLNATNEYISGTTTIGTANITQCNTNALNCNTTFTTNTINSTTSNNTGTSSTNNLNVQQINNGSGLAKINMGMSGDLYYTNGNVNLNGNSLYNVNNYTSWTSSGAVQTNIINSRLGGGRLLINEGENIKLNAIDFDANGHNILNVANINCTNINGSSFGIRLMAYGFVGIASQNSSAYTGITINFGAVSGVSIDHIMNIYCIGVAGPTFDTAFARLKIADWTNSGGGANLTIYISNDPATNGSPSNRFGAGGGVFVNVMWWY